MSYFKDGIEYPYYSLDEMAGQLVSLKNEYRTYEKYANINLKTFFRVKNLDLLFLLFLFVLSHLYIITQHPP
jgi:hypothetical protein